MHKLQLLLTAVAALATLAVASVAVAGKQGGYSPTLGTSLQVGLAGTASVPSGTPYVISGCGYAAAYGAVTVEVFTPVGVGWVTDSPDATGCISVTNFYTMGAGNYKIDAWQQLRNKAQVVAETTFSL